MAQVLVVDDEIGIRELLSEILADEGHVVRTADSARAARAVRAQERPDLVLLDIWMPDVDGISLLKEWGAQGLLTMPVVMMSGHASIDSAVEATRIGAIDFLEKPIALQKLLGTVKRALARPQNTGAADSIVDLGRSALMADLRKRLAALAGYAGSVLLRGEPGSEAELFARVVPGPNQRFANVTLNLAEATPEHLGSQAGGVLFVDDLFGLSKSQLKGLTFLAARADRSTHRFISFASADPAALVADGRLDAQTVSKLSEVVVALPALREHAEDIPHIAGAMLRQLTEANVAPARALSEAAAERLRQFAWPRNLEQLRQIVRSLALTTISSEISAQDVDTLLAQFTAPSTAIGPTAAIDFDQPLREARDAFERAYFEHLIAAEGGSISRVAERSGMERTNLYRKLKQLGVNIGRRDD